MDTFETRCTRPLLLLAGLLGCGGCTFGGLGNYDIETCAKPMGDTSTVQQVGSLADSDVTLSSVNGATPIGAFTLPAGSCVQGVGPGGYLESSCAFFDVPASPLSPRQPWVVPFAGGYAAVAVATTAPCTHGQFSFQYAEPSANQVGTTQARCTTGAALPSVVPLADGVSALVAWYETPISTRSDPVLSCDEATAEPLVAAVVAQASTSMPSLGKPVTLTRSGVSVRPPAMTALPGQSQVVVAAPEGDSVSLWAHDGALETGNQLAIRSLGGARAVSVGAATDGSGRIAVVAELGCAPQAIALAVGTLAGGFGQATVVAPAGGGDAVQPTVAWVASEKYWIVSWISATGGAYALARRFDPEGNPVGEAIDPSIGATSACVAADGSLFAYVPGEGGGSFVNASLGCAE